MVKESDGIQFERWGLIDYRESLERMKQYQRQVQVGNKMSTVIFCEHPSVITIGRGGDRSNIFWSPEKLLSQEIETIEVDRGGDVTLHSPGQLVGYFVFDLQFFRKDLHWFLRSIEECVIKTLEDFQLTAMRQEGLTGVWMDTDNKICSIGLNCSRWVTAHGFALNVSNDLSLFDSIIACGIKQKKQTSIYNSTRHIVDIEDVTFRVINSVQNLFGKNFVAVPYLNGVDSRTN